MAVTLGLPTELYSFLFVGVFLSYLYYYPRVVYYYCCNMWFACTVDVIYIYVIYIYVVCYAISIKFSRGVDSLPPVGRGLGFGYV
jgi:hypothetical protein